MVELAARYGYEMDGQSLEGSESERESASSSSKFSERYPTAFNQTRKRDHKGMSADNMKRIFATLVRVDCSSLPMKLDIVRMGIRGRIIES
jgi:hypothetical protein